MQISSRDFGYSELMVISGRVDQSNGDQITRAVETAHEHGRYNLVIDMSQIEYISSAGMRALLTAQRNSKHDHGGQLLLTSIPYKVREVLDMAGVTELFMVFDDLSSALQYAGSLQGS